MEDADEKAITFYSTMFFYYSLYDGADQKEEVKKQFEAVMNDIVKYL